MPCELCQISATRLPEDDRAAVALANLHAAVELARRGEYQAARELCAVTIHRAQPVIAVRRELLQATVYTLLMAHATELLARFVAAISGHRVRIELSCIGDATPAAPSWLHKRERNICRLDPRWLDRLRPSDVSFGEWCDLLLSAPQASASQITEYAAG